MKLLNLPVSAYHYSMLIFIYVKMILELTGPPQKLTLQTFIKVKIK